MGVFRWRDKSKKALNTIITTAFLATQLLVPVSLLGHAAADGGVVNWTGNGVTNGSLDSSQCDAQNDPNGANAPYLLWVFTADTKTVTSATLTLGGTGSGTYTMNTDTGGYKAVTPYYTLTGLTASVSYTGTLGNGKTVLTISHGCAPAKPVNPTVAVTIDKCMPNSGDSDTVNVTVTNPTDASGATVTYTVTVDGQTKTLADVADGSHATAQFTGLAAGTYTAAVSGSDGTSVTSSPFTVADCPAPLKPTVTVSTTACTINTNTTDELDVKVTNPADGTGAAVTYTVKVMSGGTVVATQTLTNMADGSFGTLQFSGLAAGSYTVSVSGSDGTSATSSSVTVHACPYLPATPTVVASVNQCLQNSGQTDTVDVVVTNTADHTGATVTYTVTFAGQTKYITLADGTHGTVSFNGLTSGTYSAQVTGNDGTSATSNQVEVKDCPYLPSSISGYKWNDLNADGKKQKNEPKLANWTIQLYGSNHTLLQTTTTNAYGDYSFTGLNLGTYTVCEVQQSGWMEVYPDPQVNNGCHTVMVTSHGYNYSNVNFGNVYNVAQIRVIKRLVPRSDSGRFNLSVNGTVDATAVGDNGTTGWVTVPAGKTSVSESAGNNSTDMSDYRSSYVCTKEQNNPPVQPEDVMPLLMQNNQQNQQQWSGYGTSFDGLYLHRGDKVTCIFTNKRIPTITIVKDARPDSSQAFTFETNAQKSDFTLVDNGTNDGQQQKSFDVYGDKLYYFKEAAVADWTQTSVTCNDGSWRVIAGYLLVKVDDGQNVTCTFVNTRVMNPVTPAAPTFTQPTCDQQLLGSYTIPDTDGVVYTVNGVVTAAGTYQALAGTTVTIVASPATNYFFPAGTQTTWSSSVVAVPTDECVLGSTDVCPNIAGDQATVPDGMTKDPSGNCVAPTGQVLGASTELANTGVGSWLGTIAGLTVILAALGLTIATRKRSVQS